MILPTLFIDIDNTLIVPHQKISDKNFKALQAYLKAGGTVVFATGKIPVAIYDLIQRLQITDSYHIGGNGAVLFNIQRQEQYILAKVGISAEKIVTESQLLHQQCFIYVPEHIYYQNTDYQGDKDERFISLGEPQPTYASHIDYEQVVKILYFIDEQQIAQEQQLRTHLKTYMSGLNFIRTATYLLEIHHQNQTKATAAKAYAEKMDINLQDCYALGDSENDLPLLAAVGHPYVMDNASAIVKEKGYPSLPACDQDGVAFLINQLLNQ